VVIEDFVEIQANSAVDRGTLSSTFIGQGTKIDNFVQIGHNCRIGKHCILCAQVGLAGSTILGDYVYLAGQVGVAGHLKIGDRAMVGAQSGITNDIPADARYWGSPAMEADRFKRILVSQKHLPEIYRFYLNKEKRGRRNLNMTEYKNTIRTPVSYTGIGFAYRRNFHYYF
jgi:UDP-3-O-[3-hydroxymyristoyl] glucosamine N-acyltransferase